MISGLIATGLASLSGFHETSSYCEAGAQKEDAQLTLDCLNGLLLSADASPQLSGTDWAAAMHTERDRLAQIAQRWPAEGPAGDHDTALAQQWSWPVDGYQGLLLHDMLAVKSWLKNQLGRPLVVTQLSGSMGQINPNRYRWVYHQPTLYWDNGWAIGLNDGPGEGRAETVAALSGFYQDNRRLSSELSGLAPFFELNPWMSRYVAQFPRGTAKEIAKLNEPLVTWHYDLSVSLSTHTESRPCIVSGRIEDKDVTLSSWNWASYVMSSEWKNPLPGNRFWQTRKPAWEGLRDISAYYGSESPVVVKLPQLSVGTGISGLSPNMPPSVDVNVDYDRGWIEDNYAARYFMPNGKWSYLLHTNLVDSLSTAADAAYGMATQGQSLHGMQEALNNCCVLATCNYTQTPRLLSAEGARVRYIDDIFQDRTVLTSGVHAAQDGFLPLPSFFPDSVMNGFTNSIQSYTSWVNEAFPTSVERVNSYAFGTVLSNTVSSVVWHRGLSSVTGQPQCWYQVPVVGILCECLEWNDSTKPVFEQWRIMFTGNGMKLVVMPVYVRADVFWCRLEGTQFVPDQNGDYLACRQASRYQRDLNEAIVQLARQLPLPVPLAPDPPRPEEGTRELCHGRVFRTMTCLGSDFLCVWYPWTGAYRILDIAPTVYCETRRDGE